MKGLLPREARIVREQRMFLGIKQQEMGYIDENGNPHTAHTTNPVPFIISGADVSLHNGRLADIAPTILDLLGLAKPEEMTGASLIDR